MKFSKGTHLHGAAARKTTDRKSEWLPEFPPPWSNRCSDVVATTFDKMMNDLSHITNFNEKALFNYKYIFNIAQQQLKLTVNLRNTFHREFITIKTF